MNGTKKYLIVSIITLMLLLVGVSFAFFYPEISGSKKLKVSMGAKTTQLVFTGTSDINDTITEGWTSQKTFTVTNNSDDTYCYDLMIDDLLNTFVSTGLLQYQVIKDGSTLINWTDIPKTSSATDTVISTNICINAGTSQNYTANLRYTSSNSNDMGKELSGAFALKVTGYIVTINAGNGISTVAATGWTNSGSSSMSNLVAYGAEIDLSTLVTPSYKTGYSGIEYLLSGEGNLSSSTFKVGNGNAIITVNATVLEEPTCSVSGGATRVYNNTDTTLTATDQSSNYDAGVAITYNFGYAANDTDDLGNYAGASTSNTISITKNLYRGTRYYGVEVIATGDGGITNSCISGTGFSTGNTVANRTRQIIRNAYINFDATTNGGTLVGSSRVYVSYQNSAVYSKSTSTATGSLPTATKEGHTFTGWYTSGGVQVLNSTPALTGTAVSGWSDSSGRWVVASTSSSAKILYAQFSLNSYIVTGAVNNSNYGSVTASASVDYGGTTTLTVTPATGYYLASASCTNGYTTNAATGSTSIPPQNQQTVTISNNSNVGASTCTFTFAPNNLAWWVNYYGEGASSSTVSPDNTTIPYNGSIQITVTPGIGYYLSSVSCSEGFSVSGITTGTSATGAQNGTVSNSNYSSYGACDFSFARLAFTATLTCNNCSTSSTNPQTVNYNSSATWTVTTASGYTLTGASTSGCSISGTTVTASNVTATRTCTVTAVEVPKLYLVTNGVDNTDVTGGWVYAGGIDGSSGSGNITYPTGYMSLYYSNVARFWTVNKYNLSNYSQMCTDAYNTTSNINNFTFGYWLTDDTPTTYHDGDGVSLPLSRTLTCINISPATGMKHIGFTGQFYLSFTGTAYVYNVYLTN